MIRVAISVEGQTEDEFCKQKNEKKGQVTTTTKYLYTILPNRGDSDAKKTTHRDSRVLPYHQQRGRQKSYLQRTC